MANPGYLDRRKWSDQFIDSVRQILAPHVIKVASFEQDTQQASDMVITPIGGIAIRVRSHEYIKKYPLDFTIRSKNGNSKTELHKLLEGTLADWVFYGFVNQPENTIIRWYIVDANVWRQQMLTSKWQKYIDNQNNHRINKDKTTALLPFRLLSFYDCLDDLLVAASGDVIADLRKQQEQYPLLKIRLPDFVCVDAIVA